MSKNPKSSKSSKNYNSKGNKETSGQSQLKPRGLNIPLTDWVVRHPFGGEVYDSDSYYHKIANRVLKIMIDEKFVPSYSLEDVQYVALSLASYFEDKVSNLCIFKAFIKEYQKKFFRDLPWYEIKEVYLYDEVNLVDVQFVMWLSLFARREGSIPNPENLTILHTSLRVYNLFLEEFDKAPVNEGLVNDIYDVGLKDNPGKLKTLLMWIASSCYLCPIMYTTRIKLQHKLDELHNLFDSFAPGMLNSMAKQYADESYRAFAQTCGPLALYPKDWYLLMCYQRNFFYHYNNVRCIEFSPVYPFAIIGDYEDHFMVCSCRGECYPVVKKSFAPSEVNNLKKGDIIIGMLFKFDNIWHVCGLAYNLYIHDLKTAFKKLDEMAEKLVDELGRKVDFVGSIDAEVEDNSPYGVTYSPLKCVKAYVENTWNRLFYFKNLTEAEKWIDKNLIGKRRRTKPGDSFLREDEPVALFITEDNRVIISNSVELIHSPYNPYYNPNTQASLLSPILDSGQLPDPMCEYIVSSGYFDNFALQSIYGKEHGRKLMQDNLNFFMTLVRQYPFYI